MFRLIIPIFLITFLIRDIKTCGRNITDLSNHDYSMELEAGCDNFLPIYPDRAIKLDIACESALSIWLIVKLENQEYLQIFHTNISIGCDRRSSRDNVWQAPKNTGLRIISEEKTSLQVKVEEKANVCGYPYVELKNNETVIQEDLSFDNLQECVYRLVPNPMEKENNQVRIKFEDETDLEYEQRFYENQNIVIKNYKENRLFFLETFDLKTKGYVEPPKITAILHKSPCIQQIERNVNPGFKTISLNYDDFEDECSHTVLIFKIMFIDMEKDEVVYFQNNFEPDRYEDFKVTEIKNKSRIIMDKTHWTRKLSIDTTELYIKIAADNYLDFIMNVTRIRIEPKCKCQTFGSWITKEQVTMEKTIDAHCKYIFCHWRMENPEKNMMNIMMKSDRALVSDQFQTARNPSYDSDEATLDISHSSHLPWVEVSFIRFNTTSNTTTDVKVAVDFTLNCECPLQNVFINVGDSKTLQSTNYPHTYCKNLDCKTLITTEPSATLEINVLYISTGMEGDVLEIYNGNTTDSGSLIKKLSGRHRDVTYESGNQAILFFQTDNVSGDNDKGYRLRVTSKPNFTTTTTTDSSISDETTPITTSTQTSDTTTSKNIEQSTTTTTIPTTTSNNKTEVSSSSHTFLIIVFLLIIVLAAIAGYIYKDKILNRPLQLNNLVDGARSFVNMNSQVF